MKTLSRTVQSARNAAENARSVAISSFQASVALPMAPMSQVSACREG